MTSYDNVFDMKPRGSSGRGNSSSSSGGDGSMGDRERIIALETHMSYMRDDLTELKAGQRELLKLYGSLPTKGDISGYLINSFVIAIAIVAIVIGGVVGGLSYISHPANPPQAARP